MDLSGRAAIVTGGARGVGRATALLLARRGCDVAINFSRSREQAEAVAAEIEGLGVHVLCAKADVADDAEVRTFVKRAAEQFGRLDFLVSNAGTTMFCDHKDLEGWSADDFQRIMTVNALGPFQCARAAAPWLKADGGGAIVHVGSIAGVRAMGSSLPYCMSKAALHNLTISLARALAPQIRVNAVAPGFIEGEWLKQGLGDAYQVAKERNERRAALGQVCQPEDVAATILALLADAPKVTGQILPIEAGLFLAT